MRTIAHISDLHFGAIQPGAPDALIDTLAAIAPDLVILSGDLALNATPREFVEAREFLDRIHAPVLSTPGNHDIPSRNMLERFLFPLRRYHRAIEGRAVHEFEDDELLVLSLNTARRASWRSNWAHGRVSLAQIRRAHDRFDQAPDHLFKALVLHHPPVLPAPRRGFRPLPLGKLLLQRMADARVDAVLTGHLHVPVWIDAQPLQLHAGTTLSSRHRDEPNVFDLIRVDQRIIAIEQWRLGDDGFAPTDHRMSVARRTLTSDEISAPVTGGHGQSAEPKTSEDARTRINRPR